MDPREAPGELLGIRIGLCPGLRREAPPKTVQNGSCFPMDNAAGSRLATGLRAVVDYWERALASRANAVGVHGGILTPRQPAH